jgi:fibronectin-binding autotransporter adhesin
MNFLLHCNYSFFFKKGNKSIEKGIFKIQKPARKGFQALHLALLLGFLYASMGGANAQTIHYVMAGGTGTGTTSWANASGDLQAMINASVSGDQIWVAGGTYKPNRQADNLTVITSDDRSNAFVLKKDVKVYGGFAGTENSLTTRNLSLTANASILSGNLGDPGINTDNAYHVVISAGDAGTSELNGFTIQDGNANADETLYITVNGNSFHAVFGGGIYNSSSSPTLTNVNINGNFALYDGGGMYNTSSNPVLTTVTITGNTATANGGGIYNSSSSPILTNMTFSGNTTTDYGGGIYNYSSSPILTDITFSENKAYLGGGIFNDNVSLPIIVNSLFTNNTANSGEAIFNQQGSVQLINSTLVGTGNNTVYQEDNGSSWKNSIIWGAIEGTGYSAAYSLIQGNTNTASGNLDASGITAADIFTDATNGNYRLKAGSLAINKGNNTYFNVGQTPDLHLITTDLDATTRIRKGVIDLGAYESSYGGPVSLIPNNGIVYITKSGNGNFTGNSWANASDDIQLAINTSNVNQVWVAGGTYKPIYPADNMSDANPIDRDNAFVLKKDVKIYGGFAGTENLLNDRNLSLTENTSILSGDLGMPVVNTDNAYHVVISAGDAGTAELNGFTIQDGNANDQSKSITRNGISISGALGGGIYNVSSSPVFSNMTISGNIAAGGGGIYNQSSNSILTNLTISGNTSTNYGGGICNVSSSPILTNITFSGNSAFEGAGIYNMASNPILTNMIFRENSASSYGGGIANENASSPTIVNSLFTNNTAPYGEAIFNDGSGHGQLINCTLAGTGNNPVFYENGTSFLKNSIVWGAINGTGYSAEYSLIQGNNNTSNHNVDATGFTATDIFVDANNGNYRIKAGSPAINTGNNIYFATGQTPDLHLITTDLDASLRIQKGVIDLGAYESSYGSPVTLIPNNGIIYVTETGNGNFTGNSWANASNDIQLGINTTNVQQVWVAGGIYKPNRRADNLSVISQNDRVNAFVLKKDVKVYGGFAGTENALSDRNLLLTNNASILSGNLGDLGINTDNAYHVVISAGDAGTSELNGFVIQDGYADVAAPINVNGKDIDPMNGGGINNISSSPNLTNITIRGSYAYNFGAGIYNESSNSNLTNLIISENTADYGGGGIYNELSSPVLTNINISGNTAANAGGGIYNNHSTPILSNVTISKNSGSGIYNAYSSPILTNTTINGNSAFRGGGIYNYSSSPRLTNVTINGNSATYFGGGIFNNSNSSPIIVNSLFSNNIAASGEAVYNSSGSGQLINSTLIGTGSNSVFYENGTSFLKNSIVWGAINGTGYSAAYSLIQGNINTSNGNLNTTGITAGDIFEDADNGNYQLKAGSPAINNGNNAYFNAGQTPDLSATTTDLDGNPRIYDGTIDMGAYELHNIKTIIVQPDVNGVVYVTPVGKGNLSGSSWANAANDLQLSINATGVQQVWVAAGTYLPNRRADALTVITPNDRNNAFVLKPNVKIYGGFAGNETALTLRDSTRTTNNTILSGDIGTVGDNNNAYHVVMSSGDVGTAELNGFTISGGNADGSGATITVNSQLAYNFWGGGIYNESSSPTISNLTISENNAYSGGGISNKSSSPFLTNVVISENNAILNGGGILNKSSSPVFTNVIISKNTSSSGSGGGIFNDSSSPLLTNVTFSGNTVPNVGGGIANLNSSPVFTNVTIIGNTAGSGGGIGNSNSSPKIRNTIIYGNNGGIYNIDLSSIPIISYSLVQGSADVTNDNIDGSTDPKFINPVAGGLSTGGDYRLQATSPAINVGSNLYFDAGQTPDLSAITTDLDGHARKQGGTIDLGAYESAVPAAVAGNINGAATVCSGTNSTTLTLSGYTGTIQWQSSTNNATFNNIEGATGFTYTAFNLTATSWYRAVVTSGGASATTGSVAYKVISGIDASASSNPVALGSAAILSATISPAISGVTVSFNVDPGTGVITTYTAVTNSSGVATTASISGLSINLYKVVATAASGCATSNAAYLAVYDPNSSFITGGGWITSPAGALVAQPFLSGKANFGFVAKYQKGKSQVDGNTEFQFQDGDFNFKSSELDAGSLVISGSKGTYRGEGTVNGAGDYGFMVSAVDGQISGGGGTDLFRIKIWDRSHGNSVVYDNNMGKDENGTPTTFLGGGSIVIHYANGKNSRIMNTGTNVEIANSNSNELTGTAKLTVTVMPNPSSYFFTLGLKSLRKEKVKITVTDIAGRVIEERTDIPANSTIRMGNNYHPGIYIAEFLQGNDKVAIRLIKEGK